MINLIFLLLENIWSSCISMAYKCLKTLVKKSRKLKFFTTKNGFRYCKDLSVLCLLKTKSMTKCNNNLEIYKFFKVKFQKKISLFSKIVLLNSFAKDLELLQKSSQWKSKSGLINYQKYLVAKEFLEQTCMFRVNPQFIVQKEYTLKLIANYLEINFNL